MSSNTYDPKEYWSRRLENRFNLRGAGSGCFDEQYNEWMYKMRKRVLDRIILMYKIDVSSVRILDIGCGTGFYVDIWRHKGARYLTGIDIAGISVSKLKTRYPQFDFFEADIASPSLINCLRLNQKKFDVVTAFDVLFHIVDDNKFEQAIKNISMLCSTNGFILITDIFPHKKPYTIHHQKSRLLQDYIRILLNNDIKIINRLPVHYLLNAPLDISSELLQKILLHFWWQRFVVNVERKTHLLGPLFYLLDLVLTKSLKESPSTEMIVCKKVSRCQNYEKY